MAILSHTRRRTPVVRNTLALALSLGAIGVVTTTYSAWLRVTNPTIVALSFLLVVLIVATVSTRWAAITTSVVAFLCFNYYFLPPVGTWTIADPENWVALFTLLAVSVIASHLSTQVRRRAMEAAASRDELGRLLDLTCDILLKRDTKDAIDAVAGFIAHRFGLSGATICLPEHEGWQLHHSAGPGPEIDRKALDEALTVARASVEAHTADRLQAGQTRLELPERVVWLVPLHLGARTIGLLALAGQDDLAPGTRDAIAGVIAIAVERTRLLEEREEAELVRRSAELKSALLASLGHDLRTPLTAVTVAANNLDASCLTEAQRHEQAQIVRSELERLNRLFANIIEIARIETDAVDAELEWIDPVEVVEAAARQADHALAPHRLTIDSRVDGALVRIDPRLTCAALAHLLENAAQYSPYESTVSVTITVTEHELAIAVHDGGRGISRQDLEHVFERAYRGIDAREARFGTGMGLAITRGLLAAEGGRVSAENHPDGGALFTITLPTEVRMATAFEVESG